MPWPDSWRGAKENYSFKQLYVTELKHTISNTVTACPSCRRDIKEHLHYNPWSKEAVSLLLL